MGCVSGKTDKYPAQPMPHIEKLIVGPQNFVQLSEGSFEKEYQRINKEIGQGITESFFLIN